MQAPGILPAGAAFVLARRPSEAGRRLRVKQLHRRRGLEGVFGTRPRRAGRRGRDRGGQPEMALREHEDIVQS